MGIHAVRVKASAVAGSLSVAVQQPTTYVRAMAELSPVRLAQGITALPRGDRWQLICKYALSHNGRTGDFTR